MATIKVPVLLSFDDENRNARGQAGFKLGRGEAGWTVMEFTTAAEALAFMSTHAFCGRPCWPRLKAQLEGAQS